MKNLDVMIVLKSGIEKLDFAEKILDIRQNTSDRLLLVFPRKKVEHHNYDIYETLTNKDFFELNWDERNWHEQPFFMINPPTYEKWINNIKYRMTGDPHTENAILLVDDLQYTGQTIEKTREELVNLGYQKEYIFSYAHTLDISDRNKLHNSNRDEITVNQLIELLK